MPKQPTARQIANAFQPSKEVESPLRFAGRRESVAECFQALMTDGGHIAIVGNRGIGKTSLARQIQLIAEGDNTLLERLKISFNSKHNYNTMYYVCGRSTSSIDDLINGLLSDNSCLRKYVYFQPKSKTVSNSYRPSASAGIFGLGAEKRFEEGFTSAIERESIDSIFSNVIAEFSRKHRREDGLLIIIDEFDRIKNQDGFGSFLKSVSSAVRPVKFCIVGVAQDIKDLISEHESTSRLFTGSIVKLAPMSIAELTEIIRSAEATIDFSIRFDMAASLFLCQLSCGQPYMVQYVGKEALRIAHEQCRSTVTIDIVQSARNGLLERSPDPFLEIRYQCAIASSAPRESVLRAFAQSISTDDEVRADDAYRYARYDGVASPSSFVSQLISERHGGELVKVRDHVYKFRDPMFAAYVNVRPRHFRSTRQREEIDSLEDGLGPRIRQ